MRKDPCVVLLFYFCPAICELFPTTSILSPEQTEILKCVEKFMPVTPISSLLSYNYDGLLVDKIAPLILVNGFTVDPKLRGKVEESRIFKETPKYYIYITDDFYNLTRMFVRPFYREGFNSQRSFFIIYFGDRSVDDVFDFLGAHLFNNIILVDKLNDVYGSKLFRQGCYNRNKTFIANCRNMGSKELLDMLQPRITSFQGCEVKAMALFRKPYVISLEENSLKPGIEVQSLNVIGKLCKFKVKFIPHNYTIFGVKVGEKNYTRMLGALFRNESDVIFGMHAMRLELYRGDFSGNSFGFNSKLVLFLPRPRKIEPWRNLLNVFQLKTWICISITYAFISVFLYVSQLVSKYKTLNILQLLSLTLLQPISFRSKFYNVVMFFILSFFSLIITSSFSSSLISFLTKQAYESKIDNLEELLESNLPVAGHPYHISLLQNDPNFSKKQLRNCTGIGECESRLVNERDIILIHDYNYMKSRRDIDEFGRPKWYVLPGWQFQYYLSVIMRKGFPLGDVLDRYFVLLREGGILQKISNDNNPQYPEDHEKQELSILTLRHLQLSFIIYFAGILLAVLTLLCEIHKNKLFRHKKVFIKI